MVAMARGARARAGQTLSLATFLEIPTACSWPDMQAQLSYPRLMIHEAVSAEMQMPVSRGQIWPKSCY